MICKKCCFAASVTLLGDSVCELRTSNPANWRTIFPQESECKYPTERRAALIAQLGVEDREALELGCRVRALTTTIFSRSRSCEHTETAETREEAAANCLIAVLEGRQHE